MGAAGASITQQELERRLWARRQRAARTRRPRRLQDVRLPAAVLQVDQRHLGRCSTAAPWQDFGEDLDAEIEADYHRFDVPEGCHWADVRSASRATLGVDPAEDPPTASSRPTPSTLAGIFGDVAVGQQGAPSRDVPCSTSSSDSTSLTLDPEHVPNDLLGGAYEYLLQQFADASGKKAGEFFTPRAVVRLLVRILDPQTGETIYDPACGSGGMLVETINAGARGQAARPAPAAALRPGGEPDHCRHRPDEPVPPRHRGLRDRARRHAAPAQTARTRRPTCGASTWSSPTLRSRSVRTGAPDGWGADDAVTPVPSAGAAGENGDYAWVQHMVASMN